MNPSNDAKQGALDRILSSPEWAQSQQLAHFLRFVVEQSMNGHEDQLTETAIGVSVFERDSTYDPKTDNVVRIEAKKLRWKLVEYYEGSGKSDPLRLDLPKGSFSPTFNFLEEPAPPPRSWKWLAYALPTVILLTGGFYWWQLPATMRDDSALRLITDRQGNSRSPAFHPAGDQIAFARDSDLVHATLFVQKLDGSAPRALTFGDVSDSEPAWSPDGNEIAFLRKTRSGQFSLMVKKANSYSSTERAFALVASRTTLDWADASSVLVSDKSAVYRILVASGERIPLTTPDAVTEEDSEPRISPDGQWISFIRSSVPDSQQLMLLSLKGSTLKAIGPKQSRFAGLAWMPDSNAIIAAVESPSSTRSLWEIPISGGESRTIPIDGYSPTHPSVARQTGALAFSARLTDTNLWAMHPTSSNVKAPLTSTAELDTSPQLSPDGKRLLWRSSRSGVSELWISASDGSNPQQLTRLGNPGTGSPQWSPDGKQVIFDSRVHGNADIFTISIDGTNPNRITNTNSSEILPSFSRKADAIYFTTDRNGPWELMRRNLANGTETKIAANGAFAAVESYDGKWIFFTRQGQELGGIWRKPAAGGEEELLVAELPSRLWGQWAVSEKAIFYAVYPGSGTQVIRRYDLQTRALSDVVNLDRTPTQGDSGMTVSRDERSLIWSQVDKTSNDIYTLNRLR
jgi:Tol biopolymer transport system component